MNLYLFDEEEIILFNLPVKRIGNFWMTDNDDKNIVNICDKDGEWLITGSENTKVLLDNKEDNLFLQAKNYYTVIKDNKNYVLYCDYLSDDSFEGYQVANGVTVNVGKSPNNEISINIPYILDSHFSLTNQDGKWLIKKSEDAVIYINNQAIKKTEVTARNGDIINIYGLKIVLTSDVIFVNNLMNSTVVKSIVKKEFKVTDEITDEEIQNEDLYKDSDYFLKSPRQRKNIETFEMSIDSPPAKENMQETPLVMTLAPMVAMAATSLMSLTNTLQSISSGNRTWKESIPALIISGIMVFSMFVWPIITRNYEKKQKKKREQNRQEKYRAYLNNKKNEIIREYDGQKKLIEESMLNTNICYDYIINKRRTLWERKLEQGDFLRVRIGKGQVNFNANINYHTEDFTMDDDDLKQMLDNLINNFKVINDVPISYSFADNKLTAISGVYPKYVDFTNNMLLQMMAFHGYDELKIVVFTNKKNEKRWKYLKNSPYVFTSDNYLRFFATKTDEMQQISDYLVQIFDGRKTLTTSGDDNERIKNYTKFNTYYLILVDDIDQARKIDIIDSVLSEKNNLGFSLMILEEKLSKIPSQVTKFITVGESASVVINNEDSSQLRFTDEVNTEYDMYAVSKTLSNLPLFIDDNIKQLPNSISFLELFGIGQIEQLNVLNRWKENDPTKSLKTEVGVNENNDKFMLDLHEKAHGPHGLIAGMTGSGKSEFIITYLLSMAVNYSPEEVAFVLIDYKGGGLAGAFVDSETGEKLPHVVGTITNLDKAEINRALSSIQSELRRRQTKFNEVRDQLNESTIDIYKYQKLYRDGTISEPIPHLIIVSDEFAELKDQQPDFMDDLISTARIGRSLGVHLILATQKPTGVVDAQIWSNSKFKICLKVQDKSDSMEMIKCDLAAELKNVGRFYLQVGYNEYFALGQSAWAGAQYYPSKEFKKAVDKNLYFIDNIGGISKTINNSIAKKFVKSEGEELTSIVKYLINIGKNSNFNIRQLWLDKISSNLTVSGLYKKYNYKENRYDINPVIGEYDDPYEQLQNILTLPITNEGNALIYGMNDSGKDELLSSIVYSIITRHTTDEVNLYLVDFGAETLMNFIDAPQVGDVVLSSDEEKLLNLSKMLNSELLARKKLFTKYNGNYKDYLKLSGRSLPNIIVMINSIEVMNELYLDLIDKFIPVIREGSKYGIYFVITTESQNSVKLKVSQSCKQILTLQLSNEMAYKDILGKTEGIIPTNNLGRGLVKIDRVCEFQTAFISNDGNQLEAINALIDKLNETAMSKAMGIPVMPDIIKLSMFNNKYNGVDSVPVGIAKESLIPSVFDFTKYPSTVISSNEFDSMKLFINNFVKTLEVNKNFNRIIIDANNYFDNLESDIEYYNIDFNGVIDKLSTESERLVNIVNQNNMNPRSVSSEKNTLCVIIGFEKFFTKLEQEYKDKFIKIMNDMKEISKINFVLFDIPGSFKKYEYDEWYKNCINTNDGIWIGQGLTQQFLLKSLVQLNSFSSIGNDYCCVIKNGMPVITKIINEIKIDEK